MFRKIDDFLSAWQYEQEQTMKLVKLLTNEALEKRLSQNVRSIRQLTWHIVSSPFEMLNEAQHNPTGLDFRAEAPKSVAEMIKAYEISVGEVNSKVINWKDDQLGDKIPMYGDHWAKGAVLDIIIRHQAHHRGQLTTMMRLVDLPVIGVYGPSFEEWKTYGMEPHL